VTPLVDLQVRHSTPVSVFFREDRKVRDQTAHRRLPHNHVASNGGSVAKVRLALMTPNPHSRRATVQNALLWGFGVVAPVVLMLLILLWGME
jgi:hypothetical protein